MQRELAITPRILLLLPKQTRGKLVGGISSDSIEIFISHIKTAHPCPAALLEQHARQLDWPPCEALLGSGPHFNAHQEDAL